MLSLQELRIRAALLLSVRFFFGEQGFLEVDTPVRQPVVLPEKNIVPQHAGDWYLQASPELCMKRLLASGCEKIFQICPCFRKGEAGRLHLEEFMMLEWYRTGADYSVLMRDCEALLRYLKEKLQTTLAAQNLDLPNGIFFGPNSVTLTGTWPRLTMKEAFTQYSPIPLEQALKTDMFEEVLVESIEPHLGAEAPVFLCDYPAEQASLATMKAEDPTVAERFELYLQGIELANGFSELTDSDEQRRRFAEELKGIGEAPSRRMPERFLQALDDLDQAAGIAFGLDRLVMLILGKKTISEAVAFSPMDL